MKTKLSAFGFFQETVPQLKRNVESIHSAEFLDDEHLRKSEILRYLNSGKLDSILFGYNLYDPFKDPPEKINDHVRLLTDGTWIWPESASYFVCYYNLSLPEEFIDHITQNEWRMPDEVLTVLQKKT